MQKDAEPDASATAKEIAEYLDEPIGPERSAEGKEPSPESVSGEGDQGSRGTAEPEKNGRKWSDLSSEEKATLESYRKDMEAGLNRTFAKKQADQKTDYENRLRELDALRSSLDSKARSSPEEAHPLQGHVDERQIPAMDSWLRSAAKSAVGPDLAQIKQLQEQLAQELYGIRERNEMQELEASVSSAPDKKALLAENLDKVLELRRQGYPMAQAFKVATYDLLEEKIREAESKKSTSRAAARQKAADLSRPGSGPIPERKKARSMLEALSMARAETGI